MIQKTENANLYFRGAILCLSILMSIVFAILYAFRDNEEKKEYPTVTRWAPDARPYKRQIPKPNLQPPV